MPARINAMCFDPGSLAIPVRPHVYTAGELALSAKIYTRASVRLLSTPEVRVKSGGNRGNIALHAALLLKKTLSISSGLEIEAENLHAYPHCGFGSSAAIQTATALAVNTLFGNPLTGAELLKLLSQNYGEEVKGNSRLIHIQSNGGGPAVALGGGMVALAGEGVVIKRKPFPDGYAFVFGIVPAYRPTDALRMFEKELAVLPRFKHASEEHRYLAAYLVLHRLLPAMEEGRIADMGDAIETYRFKCGSLFNTGQVWPEMLRVMKELRPYRRSQRIPILSTSSVGPAIYALTTQPAAAEALFQDHGLRTFRAEADNQGAIFHAK